MPQEVIEITEREIEIIEVIERGPVGPTGPQPNINYEVVSSARTLEAADLIAADTSGESFTLTLPANPSNGDAVDIFDFSETFDTNPLTIARNGQPIESLNEDLVANVEGAYFTLIYTGATRGWQILPRYGTTGGGGESVLTTEGDMVYRGAAINERLPIGTAGQILKVNSGGNAPEWGAAPATGVTSVGVSGSDGIEVDSGSPVTGSGTIALGVNAATLRSHINVADGAEVNVQSDWDATTGDAAILNKPTLGTAAASNIGDFAPASHSVFHEPTEGDELMAQAAVVTTNVAAYNGVYFWDWSELVGGRPVFYKVGSRKNYKLEYYVTNTSWRLIINTIVRAESDPDGDARPWGDVSALEYAPAAGSDITEIAVTRAPLEILAQYSAERASGVSTWSELNNKPSTFTPSAHAASHAAAGSDPVFDQDLDTTDDVAFNSVTVGEDGDLSIDDEGIKFGGELKFSPEEGNFYAGGEVIFGANNTTAAQFFKPIAFAGANAVTNAATSRSNLGLGDSATADIGTGSGDVAAGNHTHELANLDATGATDGHVLTADGAGGAAFEAIPSTALNDLSNVSAAAPSDNDVLVYDTATSTWVAEAPAAGGVSAIGTSAADVLSVSGSDLVADDGGTVDSADPFIKWDDTAGKLVYANPLSRPTGAMYVGLAPTTTALGTDAINIQGERSAATQVASTTNAIAIGNGSTASGTILPLAIGRGAVASGTFGPIAIGGFASATAWNGIAIGSSASGTGPRATANYAIGIGRQLLCNAQNGVAINGGDVGDNGAQAVASVVIGGRGTMRSSLRGQFLAYPFSSVFWGGQTTDATPTILNLDATATNRFTIAANTALAVDILLVARRSDTADKWLVARRFLGIRRDGSNNTSLIGSVQTLGTDQTDGSPSWTFALTADDTNEALQLEVTGAASETVQWRATAFYREV